MADLISRQWLMECVNEGWIKFDTEKDENRFIHLVRDIAPSAQPEPCKDAVKREDVQSIAEKSDWFESSDSFNDFMWALYELPSAQPEHTSNNDCNGCKFVGCYDTDFPCANCIRKNKDYYTPERRTDE